MRPFLDFLSSPLANIWIFSFILYRVLCPNSFVSYIHPFYRHHIRVFSNISHDTNDIPSTIPTSTFPLLFALLFLFSLLPFTTLTHFCLMLLLLSFDSLYSANPCVVLLFPTSSWISGCLRFPLRASEIEEGSEVNAV